MRVYRMQAVAAVLAIAQLLLVAAPAQAQFNCWGGWYDDPANPNRTCTYYRPMPGSWTYSGPGFDSWNHCAEGWNYANCLARGGTITPGAGCEQPNYCVGANETNTDATLPSMAASIIQIMRPTCSPTTSDSGWGAYVTLPYGAVAGPDTYEAGELVGSGRYFEHQMTSQCSQPETRYHLGSKTRNLNYLCPVGTTEACWVCGTYCTREQDNTCPTGNPVKPGAGGKVLVETVSRFREARG